MKASNRKMVGYDIVVIGAGASGLVAALTAAEGGAKVVVFEKMGHVGGSSNYAEGMFAVESDLQRQSYITYSCDEAFKAIMDYSHWRANARLVRAFVDESAGTIRWLQKQGVEFIESTTNMPDGPRTFHVLKGHQEAMGATMIKILVTRAREMGVEVRLATAMKKILREDGQIAGVIVEKAGKKERVNAKTVVVASGGYGNNKGWIKKYSGLDLGINIIPVGNINKVGDGIRMSWEVGAAEEGIGVLQFFRVGPMGPGVRKGRHLVCAAVQPELWVNQHGERFCDEGIAFNDTFEGNAVAKLREGYSYTIFDETAKQSMVKYGIAKNMAIKSPPGTCLTDFDKELQVALEKGNLDVAVADSIEKLARKIGVPLASFKSTVQEYNKFCEAGRDGLFAKEPSYLHPLLKPKFYALKAYTVFLGSLGGIKINHRMEVVDQDEEVIPGLYAVGTDAGGLYGDSYNFKYSTGATLGFAANSGRIAGRNALLYIGK
jgi:fumarate reductase flavoprotein subunit